MRNKILENIGTAFMILFFVNGSGGFLRETMKVPSEVQWFWFVLHGLNMMVWGTILFNKLRTPTT